MESNLLFKLILIGILTMINAFFASAEMAIVSCNKNSIRNMVEEGNKKARALLRLMEDQTKFLSTIQVGITLAGFFASGSAATSITVILADQLHHLNIPYAHTIAFILITFILSYITLVFGELIPKRIALQDANKVAMRSAKTIQLFSKIAHPFVRLLSISTTFILRILGKYSTEVEERFSEEELKSYIRIGQEQGVINPGGEQMLVSILDFDDKMAREIMTPRIDMYMVDFNDFDKKSLEELLDKGYSRVPVYKEDKDQIIGILTLKDLFQAYYKDRSPKKLLERTIKDAYFVPETRFIDLLLQDMQRTKHTMAILIDEFGGVSGLVTIEDIVEEIVGDIQDEYDRKRATITPIGDHTYLADGHLEIDEINEKLDIDLPNHRQGTISGLMMDFLGFIPEDGRDEKYRYVYENRYELKGNVVENRRFKNIQIKIYQRDEKEEIDEE